MARWFIRVEIEAASWASNVPCPSVLLWKKSRLVFSRARMKSPAQSMLHIAVQSRIQHSASGACGSRAV